MNLGSRSSDADKNANADLWNQIVTNRPDVKFSNFEKIHMINVELVGRISLLQALCKNPFLVVNKGDKFQEIFGILKEEFEHYDNLKIDLGAENSGVELRGYGNKSIVGYISTADIHELFDVMHLNSDNTNNSRHNEEKLIKFWDMKQNESKKEEKKASPQDLFGKDFQSKKQKKQTEEKR